MKELISVIIPVRNGGATIGKCLEALFASDHDGFEVIVVDDCSGDDTIDIIKKFPCRLFRMSRQEGAARCRNRGAQDAGGKILFFIDADCLVRRDTLARVARASAEAGSGTIVGGTYTREPHDPGFFSRFQSVFINYFETKNADNPDYVASHAMAIHASTFRSTGGFPEAFLPIIEDVEYSHRLRRSGYRLRIDPAILVSHVFGFDLRGSLRNAFRKSAYWVMYSLANRDLFADSGTASRELKSNTAVFFLIHALLLSAALLRTPFPAYPVPLLLAINAWISSRLFRAFRETGGMRFAVPACCYYALIYPVAVGAGAASGLLRGLIR